ncbi:unnamed protein product [Ilex paraguariensis]|uniref:Uncharacterized protein n=1 Tax=Ilex paraguariensis TaxID=185542 RepID=A0ABC8TAQ1_9AQUA
MVAGIRQETAVFLLDSWYPWILLKPLICGKAFGSENRVFLLLGFGEYGWNLLSKHAAQCTFLCGGMDRRGRYIANGTSGLIIPSFFKLWSKFMFQVIQKLKGISAVGRSRPVGDFPKAPFDHSYVRNTDTKNKTRLRAEKMKKVNGFIRI